MCLSPITINNPRYKSGNVGLNYLFNTTDTKLQVPCGSCPQCTALRQSFYLQRVQMESLRSHLFMFTLTYNDESLVYTDVADYSLPYPVISDVQNLFKRLRRKGYNFRYTYVSEYGRKHHRPHFHGIFALDKNLGDPKSLEVQFSKLISKEWRRNYATIINNDGNIVVNTRNSSWRSLYTPVYKDCRCTTFDFHYIEPIRGHDNDVSFYVSKYVTKYDKWIRSLLLKILLDDTLDDEQKPYLYDLLKPRCNTSKDFGDWKDPEIFRYIKKCASRKSEYRYPQFYDINTGKSMPMSPYYGKRLVDFVHLYNRSSLSDEGDNLSTVFYDNDTILDYRIQAESSINQFQDFDKKLKKLYDRLEV